jgi:hypothetical protein
MEARSCKRKLPSQVSVTPVCLPSMPELESHDYGTANMKELRFRSHLQKVNRDAGHLGFNDVMVIAGLWPA